MFILFLLAALVFTGVIITFVRWVDRIARLGRLGATIDTVETATADALQRRRNAPTLYGVPDTDIAFASASSRAIFSASVGYVQHIDIGAIQAWASARDVRVAIAALPGTFVAPGRAIAHVIGESLTKAEATESALIGAFQIGGDRLFDDDPRFGLVVLSEIAGRALSPAVNDPGTAIDIVGTFVRLFAKWNDPPTGPDGDAPTYDRVAVPELLVRDMFDDAFTSIARDGAGMVEVAVQLQTALQSLATIGSADMRSAANYHAKLALKRAAIALDVAEDVTAVREAAHGVLAAAEE